MLENLKKGKRTGLIGWHPDRLSRNEKDAREITYMIRMGIIEDLKFGTYHFENTPEGIWMLQMALSQSQYESAKKGRDVKRGLEKSAKMGFYPCPAPVGYIDDKYGESGKKKKLPDPERFDMCRKMVDMMLTGKHTPPQILKIANEEWGFKGPRGAKKMSRSNIYNLFTNPFYYGEFEYPKNSGNWYEGNHQPMMNKEEYDKIQKLLGRKSQSRKPKDCHEFSYRGPIRCGECGAMVTAEMKVKRQKNGNVHIYTYYHCTKRVDPNCTQKSIREDDLEKQIAIALSDVEIPEEFTEWALDELRKMNDKEVNDRDTIYSSQRREYEACVRKIDNLIDMRANGEIDEMEFKKKKSELLQQKSRFNEMLQDTDKRIDNWFEVAERGFKFAEKACITFANGDLGTKKEIFSAIGSDLILKDKKISIYWENLLFPMEKLARKVKDVHERLEPSKYVGNKEYLKQTYSKNPQLLPVRDSNPNFLDQNQASCH